MAELNVTVLVGCGHVFVSGVVAQVWCLRCVATLREAILAATGQSLDTYDTSCPSCCYRMTDLEHAEATPIEKWHYPDCPIGEALSIGISLTPSPP